MPEDALRMSIKTTGRLHPTEIENAQNTGKQKRPFVGPHFCPAMFALQYNVCITN